MPANMVPILNNSRSFALIAPVNFLALRAKVNYARALFLYVFSVAGPLPQLANLLTATQTRQVSTTKHHVPRAVFAARLIHERRIARHPFAIVFRGRCTALVCIARHLRNCF